MSGCCNPEHHHCEPTTYDMASGDTWDCPECGAGYVAVRIGDRAPQHRLIQDAIHDGLIDEDRMMWTSRRAARRAALDRMGEIDNELGEF